MKKVNYLRLSITDRCNLRCIYCLPFGKDRFIPHNEIMRYEEMTEAVGILGTREIECVRITGGEPLVRRDVEDLVRMLKEIEAVKEVSMTTNGVLLRQKLPALLENGLDRVNVSLNTLKSRRYKELTGADKFDEVWLAIKEILSAEVLSLKINVVILKGMNDDEAEDFAAFTLENNVAVRFIEYFPMGGGRAGLAFVPNSIIRKKIERKFGLLIPAVANGNGPALSYRIKGARGQIGFISTRTGNYCNRCNRLRLTSEGRLFPCLFSPFSINLKKMLREAMKRDEILKVIDELIRRKSRYSKNTASACKVEMSRMGG